MAVRPAPLAEQLLDAAEAEVAEHGLAALSMRAVARRVGVSHQAPGFAFGDRAGLMTALATRGWRLLERRMIEVRSEMPARIAPGDRVGAIGVGYMLFAEEHPALFTVMFRAEELHAPDPELIAARVAARAVLVEEVEVAHAAGWGAGHEADLLALVCWSVVHGGVMLRRDGALAGVYPAEEAARSMAERITTAVTSAFSE